MPRLGLLEDRTLITHPRKEVFSRVLEPPLQLPDIRTPSTWARGLKPPKHFLLLIYSCRKFKLFNWRKSLLSQGIISAGFRGKIASPSLTTQTYRSLPHSPQYRHGVSAPCWPTTAPSSGIQEGPELKDRKDGHLGFKGRKHQEAFKQQNRTTLPTPK